VDLIEDPQGTRPVLHNIRHGVDCLAQIDAPTLDGRLRWGHRLRPTPD
jgi:hypothetical protein